MFLQYNQIIKWKSFFFSKCLRHRSEKTVLYIFPIMLFLCPSSASVHIDGCDIRMFSGELYETLMALLINKHTLTRGLNGQSTLNSISPVAAPGTSKLTSHSLFNLYVVFQSSGLGRGLIIAS